MENNQESRLGGCARMHLFFLPSQHTHPATDIHDSPRARCPGLKHRYFCSPHPLSDVQAQGELSYKILR